MDKNTNNLTVPFVNQSTVTECGEEFTLPDYYPEVKRVVSVLCRVLPESRYDGGETAEESGTVTFTVIYLGDDGSLACVPLNTDYSASIPMPKTEDSHSGIFADTLTENVTCRATGPRRLSIRAKLRTVFTADGYISAEGEITDTSGGSATAAEKISVQTLDKSEKSLIRVSGKATGTVSGEIRERPGTKPIMCDGEIAVNEAVPSEGAVILRGDAYLWCICFGDDGLYRKVTAKAPFEERIPIEGDAPASGALRGYGRCASTTVKESDDGTLSWDMEFDLECEAAYNREAVPVCDMYSTMWLGNTVQSDCDSLSLLKCGNGRLSLTGSTKRSGNGTAGDYIIGSYGKAVCTGVEYSGTRPVVTGSAEIKVLLCGGGEVTEETARLPFRYECESGDAANGDIFWRCDAVIADCSARLEGNAVQVTAELCLSIFAGVKSPVRYVTRLELDRTKPVDSRDGRIRLYYPNPGETVWDITKKYGIPKTAVEDGGDCIII